MSLQSPEFVKDIIRELFPNNLYVGMVTIHPETGKKIKIISGHFLDPTYGRLSNFWTWREVLKDGTLSKKKESGYGWGTSVDIKESE